MSRSLDHLDPRMRDLTRAFLDRCVDQGLDLLVTCTYRSPEEQRELYRIGRDLPGKKVTWAQPGESLHNAEDADGHPASRAVDVVPLRLGKPVWGTKGDDLVLWQRVGAIGKSVGLEWAGDWVKFKELCHFQVKPP